MLLFDYLITDSAFFSTSISLEGCSVQKNGSLFVKIWCAFKEGIKGASCVVVYREYGNKTLVVKEYFQNSIFPVYFTVNHPNETKYTLAVFGKNGFDIDKNPYYFMAEERETSCQKNFISLISGSFLVLMCIWIHMNVHIAVRGGWYISA